MENGFLIQKYLLVQKEISQNPQIIGVTTFIWVVSQKNKHGKTSKSTNEINDHFLHKGGATERNCCRFFSSLWGEMQKLNHSELPGHLSPRLQHSSKTMKEIVVKNCAQCPHKELWSTGILICVANPKMARVVGVIENICASQVFPDFCPLNDYGTEFKRMGKAWQRKAMEA